MVAAAFERDSLFSLIVGPMVWIAHFLTLYVFTAIACARGFFEEDLFGVPIVPLVGGFATAVALALILHAGYVAWRRWRGRPANGAPPSLPPHDRNDVASRRRFMAFAALLLCGAALIATIWETLPILFFSSCR